MTQQDVPAGPADDELLAAVRRGDLTAFGTLFARHHEAARRLARQLTRSTSDADDLVAGAFEKVLDQLRAGKGPEVAFRAYLLTALRRLHVDQLRATQRVRPSEDADLDRGVDFEDSPLAAFEHGTAAAAFASLPERWQTVLWHLDVEGEKPAAVGPLLGMSANGVSALAYRAREGLRQAYLQQHLREQADDEHQRTLGQLGAYVRSGLSRRDATKVREHLDRCPRCTAVYLELDDVNSRLGALIGPALLGAAAAGYLGAGAGGLKLVGVVGGWWTSARDWAAGSTTHTLVAVAGTVTVAAVAGGLVYVVTTQGPDDVTSSVADRSGGRDADRGDREGDATGLPGAAPSAPAPSASPSAVPPTALRPSSRPPRLTTPTAPGSLPGSLPGAPGAGNGSGSGSGSGSGGGAGGPGPGGGSGGGENGSTDGDGSFDGGSGSGGGTGGGTGSPQRPPLAGSADVSASVGDDDVTVRWRAVAGARGYDVFRVDASAGGGGRAALSRAAAPVRLNDRPVTGTSMDDVPPAAGTYAYAVRAVRGSEHGPRVAATAVEWEGALSRRGTVRTIEVAGTAPSCVGATGGLVGCAGAPSATFRGGTVRVGTQCLTAVGSTAVLRACTGGAAQRWTVGAAEPQGAVLRSAGGDYVTRDGDALVLRDRLAGSERRTRPQRFDLPDRSGLHAATTEEPAAALGAPSFEAEVTDGGDVRLTWTPAADVGDDVDGYRIVRDGVVGGALPPSATSHVDDDVEPGDHTYAVEAVRTGDEPAAVRSAVVAVRVSTLVARDQLRFTTAGRCVGLGAGGSVVATGCGSSGAGPAATWAFWADGTIRVGDRCLRSPRARLGPVTLGTCSGDGLTWRTEPARGRTGAHLLDGAGLVLDARGGGLADGTAMIVYPHNGPPATVNQVFDLPDGVLGRAAGQTAR